jgi:hypothetical protein
MLVQNFRRRSIVLFAGNKAGMSTKRFYKQLMQIADRRFTEHIAQLEEEGQ